MNMNVFAVKVAKLEKKKISLPIGQIKEVIGIVLRLLAAMPESEALKVIHRYRKKKKR